MLVECYTSHQTKSNLKRTKFEKVYWNTCVIFQDKCSHSSAVSLWVTGQSGEAVPVCIPAPSHDLSTGNVQCFSSHSVCNTDQETTLSAYLTSDIILQGKVRLTQVDALPDFLFSCSWPWQQVAASQSQNHFNTQTHTDVKMCQALCARLSFPLCECRQLNCVLCCHRLVHSLNQFLVTSCSGFSPILCSFSPLISGLLQLNFSSHNTTFELGFLDFAVFSGCWSLTPCLESEGHF